MRLLVMGPPGAGKGTQAAILSQKLGIPHISTGEMFRKAMQERTGLGRMAQEYISRGELVPDTVTEALVKERITREDCRSGYLLDGFPRNLEQGKDLDRVLKELGHRIDAAIYLDVPNREILCRLTKRRVCQSCARVYHLENQPPETADRCDACGGTLAQREDDREETVKRRLKVHRQATRPLMSFYRHKGLLCVISGDLSVQETFRQIVAFCLKGKTLDPD